MTPQPLSSCGLRRSLAVAEASAGENSLRQGLAPARACVSPSLDPGFETGA